MAIDDIAPLLASTFPDNRLDMSYDTVLQLVFNEAMMAGTGIIEIRRFSDNSLFSAIDVSDASQVSFTGNAVLIDPGFDFEASTKYYVNFAPGVLVDLAGNADVGISGDTKFNFTTITPGPDTTPPTITRYLPPDNTGNVLTEFSFSLEFDEIVKPGSGNIEIRTASDGALFKSISVDDSQSVFFAYNGSLFVSSILLAPGTEYYVLIDGGAILDSAGNPFAGIASPTEFNFTTGGSPSAPWVVDISPTDNSMDVDVNSSVVFTFSESVKAGSGTIVIRRVDNAVIFENISVTDATRVFFVGNQMIVDPSGPLVAGVEYSVTMPAGTVLDLGNVPFAGIESSSTLNFSTLPGGGETAAPILNATSPADDTSNVPVTSAISLTFDENVDKGWGDIEIRKLSDGSLFNAINIFDSTQVTFVGGTIVIDPHVDLISGTEYFILFDSGVVTDLAGNAFSGISSPETLNFSTAGSAPADSSVPVLLNTSPADDAGNVTLRTAITLNFSEEMKAGFGNIEFRRLSDHAILESISVGDVTRVVFTGNDVTIEPDLDFPAVTNIYVTIASGVFQDLAGNDFRGISDTSGFNFMTGTDAWAPALLSSSPVDDATGVAINADIVLTFTEPVLPGAGRIQIRRASDGNLVANIAVGDASQVVFSGNQVAIDPSINFAANTDYYIVLNDTRVFEDLVGHDFLGLTAPGDLNFTTGDGMVIDFGIDDPLSYMSAIRDFDGNDLGGLTGWKLIGSADAQNDGDTEHVLVNEVIGRWATVGPAVDGLIYFGNHGSGGDTRVVGIYIDPLVISGDVVQFGPFDSQQRFQNDLFIDNIASVLGGGDYDGDGLQELYFGIADETAYLHAYMHADGNIQYANYQNETQMIDYLAGHGFGEETWGSWLYGGAAPFAGAGVFAEAGGIDTFDPSQWWSGTLATV